MHEPVLVEEVMKLLQVESGGTYVDATAGGGGHSEEILKRASKPVKLLALDKDEDAVCKVKRRLNGYGSGHEVAQGDFSELDRLARENNLRDVDGILMDLGISSNQLADKSRGFSFAVDGPLDMRMDLRMKVTAEDIVNNCERERLEEIFRVYGEERYARRIARAIVMERKKAPVASTGRLASIVSSAVPRHGSRIHPATRVFQALRIAVNDELENLKKGLDAALGLLRPGGRLAAISFHSLEDRIVKRFFVEHRGRMESLQGGGAVWNGVYPRVRIITRGPVTASESEVKRNPRSRSAKLRVCEKKDSSITEE